MLLWQQRLRFRYYLNAYMSLSSLATAMCTLASDCLDAMHARGANSHGMSIEFQADAMLAAHSKSHFCMLATRNAQQY